MAELPRKSPIQFHHLADGQVKLVGRPDVVLKVHEEQANTGFPDWYRSLGLPTYEEEWDALSIEHGPSGRFVRFILCDESPTKHTGHLPLQPARIRLQPGRYYNFTLSHTTYLIGRCFPVMLHPKEMTRVFKHLPDFIEGDCLIGEAEFCDSKLADIAWRGLERKIFTHSCAVLSQHPEDPAGAGDLVEIALVSEAEAACPGARVLKWWGA